MITNKATTIRKTLVYKLALFCVVFLLGGTQPIIGQGMSGTFTVGSPSHDFVNLSQAITALNSANLNGTVTFLIAPGTHQWPSQGSIVVSNPGSIFFKTLTGNQDVILEGQTGGPFIDMTLAPNVYFRNLTIRNASGSPTFTAIEAEEVLQLQVDDCRIELGSVGTGIYAEGGFSTGVTRVFVETTVIEGGDNGIIANEQHYTEIKSCTLEDQEEHAIDLYKGIDNYILENQILDFGLHGIAMVDCDGYTIEKNNVVTNVSPTNGDSRSGIYLYECDKGKGQDPHSLVENNMVSVLSRPEAQPQYGISLMKATNEAKVYHNSVHVHGRSSSGAAFHIDDVYATVALNNIFSNEAADPAIVKNQCGPTTLNYTNYFTDPSPNVFAVLNGTPITDLGTWKAATSHDNNSMDQLPKFTSNTDLHVCNTGLIFGTSLSIPNDIDGDQRATPPYVGADEGVIPPAVLVSSGSGCTRTFTCTQPANATFYYWDFGDGNTLVTFGNNSTSHTYSSTGFRNIIVRAYTPCGVVEDDIWRYIVCNNKTDLNGDLAESEPKLEITPSPANEYLQVNWDGPLANISIYDLQGKLVHRSTTQAQNTIDVSAWSPGIYLLRLSNETTSKTRKLVIGH